MGVLVILKFRFAKVVSLAVSIGNHMRPLVGKLFGRFLAAVIPEEYHQVQPPKESFRKLSMLIIIMSTYCMLDDVPRRRASYDFASLSLSLAGGGI